MYGYRFISCLDTCPKRAAGCHATCDNYKAAKAKQDSVNDARHRESLGNYYSERSIKMDKMLVR